MTSGSEPPGDMAGSSSPGLEDQILGELFDRLESGESLDGAALTAIAERFPGHDPTVHTLARAACRYRKLAASMRGRNANDELAPGTRLGDFEIVEFVGRGGMAAVYRARQASLAQREVALKVVDVGSATPGSMDRFRREARALAGLHHPRLAEVFGFGEDQGRLFYAMRLVRGPTLRCLLDRLARRREAGRQLSEPERRQLVRWALEVGEALATVHAAGLVHRDVKPSNVMIDAVDPEGDGLPQGRAVLVDFGLVRDLSVNERTFTQLGAGSLPYSAPEQLAGLGADARSDVFALGMTLHDLLSGCRPEDRVSERGPSPPLGKQVAGSDGDLAAVLGKATEPEPDWRYSDGRAMADDLDAWLAGDLVHARRPPPGERARRWLARHPGRVLASIVGIVLLSLLIAGGVALTDTLRQLRRARAAYEAGDVVALSDALLLLDDLPALMLLEPGLLTLRRELLSSARDAGSSLGAISRAWRAGDSSRALLFTATRMRVDGLRAEPLLLRSMLASIGGDSDLSRRALSLLARWAYERPDLVPRDVVASRPLRDRTRRLLTEGGVSRHERLLALTVLSGCGVACDAETLAGAAMAEADDAEFKRLALMAVERILRRQLQLGSAPSLDLAAPVWSDVKAWIARTMDEVIRRSRSGVGGAWDFAETALRLEWSLALVVRRSGCRLDLINLRSAEYMAGLMDDSAEGWLGLVVNIPPVTSIKGKPLLSWLEGGGAAAMLEMDARRLGRLLGVLPAPGLTARLRESLFGESDDLLAELETGIVEGHQSVRGVVTELDLDADTLLGVDNPEDSERRLRVGEICRAWPPNFGDLSVPSLACWRFDAPTAQLSGQARGVGCGDAGWFAHGDVGYFRLCHPDRSRLTFTFDIPPEAASKSLLFRLLMLSASRVYYPEKGVSFVRAALDGLPLGCLAVHQHDIGQGALDMALPSRALTVGRHRIDLLLNAQSLGPLWIFGAALVVR